LSISTVDMVEISKYKKLAAKIIKLAAEDVLMLPKGHEDRIDAEIFFESEWFYEIADLININPDSFREKLFQKQNRKRKAAIA
jgi:hypothetical protein